MAAAGSAVVRQALIWQAERPAPPLVGVSPYFARRACDVASRASCGNAPLHPAQKSKYAINNKGGKDMVRKIIIAAAYGAVLAASSSAFAQQLARLADGSEARAMLMNVVIEVKVNREKAFEMFNQGEGRFLNGDIYVFCTDARNGKFVAMGNANAKDLLGQDVRTLKDPTGKAYGQEIYAAGQKPESDITEVSYLFAKPSDPKPAAKTSFVTRVDEDYACGVGYYK
jgi:hypothetical protein